MDWSCPKLSFIPENGMKESEGQVDPSHLSQGSGDKSHSVPQNLIRPLLTLRGSAAGPHRPPDERLYDRQGAEWQQRQRWARRRDAPGAERWSDGRWRRGSLPPQGP